MRGSVEAAVCKAGDARVGVRVFLPRANLGAGESRPLDVGKDQGQRQDDADAPHAHDAFCERHERRGPIAHFLRPDGGRPGSAGGVGSSSISGGCSGSWLQHELWELP